MRGAVGEDQMAHVHRAQRGGQFLRGSGSLHLVLNSFHDTRVRLSDAPASRYEQLFWAVVHAAPKGKERDRAEGHAR
jgi:hypothetical protein